MKTLLVIASLILPRFALSQATIAVTCTSCTSGNTTVTANSFQATGVSAGGLNLPTGSPPSTPGVGLTTDAITLFAPLGMTTQYGVVAGGPGF